MKKTIISFAGALCALTLQAQTPADTIRSIENARLVTVTQSRSVSQIVIQGTEENPDFYYSFTSQIEDSLSRSGEDQWEFSLPFLKNKPHSKAKFIYGENIYVGATIPMSEPEGLDGSVEFGVGSLAGIQLTPWKKGPSFTIGLGIHYRQYTLHGSQIFSYADHRLSIIPVEADKVSSRLRNFGFQVPLSIFQPFYKDFGITVGASAMFNTFTRAASDHIVDDVRYHQSFRGLHQRLLTVDIFGSIGWKDSFGIYVRYSPVSTFSDEWGPKFKTLSVGVTLSM